MHWAAKLMLALGAFLALTVGTAVLAYPAAAAIACPACYGYEALNSDFFVERSIAPAEREHLMTIVDDAFHRVRDFYGSMDSHPRIFICATDVCYRRLGGGSRGMAVLDQALFLSPRGADVAIAAHELSHIELHHRLGLVGTLRRDIPQWFDEGVAVVVSKDPRYPTEPGRGDRCRAGADEPLPAARRTWIEQASHDQLYQKAACRVASWMAAHGGTVAVTRLIARVAGGTSFDAAYR
jgi:hypothetical protein